MKHHALPFIALIIFVSAPVAAQRMLFIEPTLWSSNAVYGTLKLAKFNHRSNAVIVRVSSPTAYVAFYDRQLDSVYRATFPVFENITDAVWDANKTAYVSVEGYGVYATSDLGHTWSIVNDGLDVAHVQCLALDSSGSILAGTYNGLYRLGLQQTWDKIASDLQFPDFKWISVLPNGNFLMHNPQIGLQESDDQGTHWHSHSLNTIISRPDLQPALYLDRYGAIYLFSNKETFISSDNGAMWSQDTSFHQNFGIIAFTIQNNIVFADGYLGYRIQHPGSIELGYYWNGPNQKIRMRHVYIDEDGICYFDGGQYRTNYALTGIGTVVPNSHTISQVYPNPVDIGSPGISVRYTLSTPASPLVAIYNTLGVKVFERRLDKQGSGEQVSHLDLAGLPSGLYLYTLSTGANSQTGKFVIR